MNRKEEINKFLIELRDLYEQNPDLEIKIDTIYYELMKYDTDGEEESISNIIDTLNDSSYAYSLNLFVEYSPGFLHFRSASNSIDTYYERTMFEKYKFYLNFPKDKIEECVRIIFAFIGENKFSTASKLADIIRSDSLVIRMDYEDEAREVVNFINQNETLRKYARKTNPFLPREGIVGYGYDERLSYNAVLSTILKKYYEIKKKENNYSLVSYEDFQLFVKESINSFDSMYLDEEYVKEKLNSVGSVINKEDVIKNFHIVTSFIYDGVLKDSIDSYFDKINKNKIEKYKLAEDPKKLLDEFLRFYFESEERSLEEAYGGINEWIIHHNSHSITRKENFRERFEKSIKPEIIKIITKGNLSKYILKFRNKISQEKIKQMKFEEDPQKLIYSYLDYQLKKIDLNKFKDPRIMNTEGLNNIARTFNNYCNSYDSSLILEDENFRERFKKNISEIVIWSMFDKNKKDFIFSYNFILNYARNYFKKQQEIENLKKQKEELKENRQTLPEEEQKNIK